jgi:hypothetical protein
MRLLGRGFGLFPYPFGLEDGRPVLHEVMPSLGD